MRKSVLLRVTREGVVTAGYKQYEIVLAPQPNGGFTATVPEPPDVVTEGETREQATAMARDAIEGYIDTMREPGWLVD
jgi:predicted RNase H-like HicB family nuclease